MAEKSVEDLKAELAKVVQDGIAHAKKPGTWSQEDAIKLDEFFDAALQIERRVNFIEVYSAEEAEGDSS